MTDFKKWLLKNLDLKLLALIMSAILWFYFSSEYNISDEKYYDIEIRPINLSKTLSIKEIRDKVSVGIKGPKNTLENISTQKMVGTVDLEGIQRAGEYQLGIHLDVPKNTEIIKIIPDEVFLEIEEIIEKEYGVEYNLIGLPQKGYSLKDEPKIVPEEVTIVGPSSILDQIGHVRIDIDISSIREDINKEEEVFVYTNNNDLIQGVNVEPEIVSVYVQVDEGYPEKLLPVKPRIVGKPAPGYFISKIEANPSSLEIYGNYSKILGLDFLETIPIDVTGISKTLTVRIPPIASEGVSFVEGEQALIEVKIEVEETEEEKVFEGMMIELRETSPFLDYQLNPEKVDVKVAGKYHFIADLKREHIHVFVNLSNIETEKLKVEVELPSEIHLVELIPEEITISMKK
ncbi:MAG: hypothetical protein JXC36_08385 [Candidatus Atribacteria bacterium]|nr:hypothetical protein [Candidatus Atribacteria bacterium]